MQQRYKLDEKDLLILTAIRENPTASITELVDHIALLDPSSQIPYPTVQKRVKSLIRNGAVQREISADLAAFGYAIHCRIDIFVAPSELRRAPEPHKAKTQKELAQYIVKILPQRSEFKDRIFIKDAFIMLGGEADITLDVYGKDYKQITEFVTQGLRNLPGISNTSTALLQWSAK